MVNVVGSKDNYDRFKPDGFEKYKTMAEVCAVVNRDRRRITQLEKAGKLPKPVRVKVGRLSVRLYDAKQVRTIKRYFETAKPGNPSNRKHKRPAKL